MRKEKPRRRRGFFFARRPSRSVDASRVFLSRDYWLIATAEEREFKLPPVIQPAIRSGCSWASASAARPAHLRLQP
jgi:hypothetical protein